MKEYIRRYFMLRRHNMKVAIKKAKMSKMCYAFLAPYAIIFALFYILPVITSIFYSFTYYNILESPKFVGLQNYINLILQDDVFLIGVKNRLSLLLSQDRWAISPLFLFAWLINELPRWGSNDCCCCVLCSFHCGQRVRYFFYLLQRRRIRICKCSFDEYGYY